MKRLVFINSVYLSKTKTEIVCLTDQKGSKICQSYFYKIFQTQIPHTTG